MLDACRVLGAHKAGHKDSEWTVSALSFLTGVPFFLPSPGQLSYAAVPHYFGTSQVAQW